MHHRLLTPKVRRKRLKKKAKRLSLFLFWRRVRTFSEFIFPRMITDKEYKILRARLHEKFKNIEMV